MGRKCRKSSLYRSESHAIFQSTEKFPWFLTLCKDDSTSVSGWRACGAQNSRKLSGILFTFSLVSHEGATKMTFRTQCYRPCELMTPSDVRNGSEGWKCSGDPCKSLAKSQPPRQHFPVGSGLVVPKEAKPSVLWMPLSTSKPQWIPI